MSKIFNFKNKVEDMTREELINVIKLIDSFRENARGSNLEEYTLKHFIDLLFNEII